LILLALQPFFCFSTVKDGIIDQSEADEKKSLAGIVQKKKVLQAYVFQFII